MTDTITISRRPTEAQIIAWANSALRNVPDKSLTRQFMRDLLRDFADGLDALSVEAATPAPREDGYSAGVRAAAALIAKRRDSYIEDHGIYDPSTGVTEFPGDGDEYVGELEEIEEAILSLLDAPEHDRINKEAALDKLQRLGQEWDADPPTPACTATDGPASASVYRAPEHTLRSTGGSSGGGTGC